MDATDPQSQQNVVSTVKTVWHSQSGVYLDKDPLHTCGGKQTVILHICVLLLPRVRAM